MDMPATFEPRPPLVDPFGREITYLRVSVTDRCDFRCVYCMAEDMTFLPKKDVLSLEELDRLCSAFVARGVRKLRLTGGEPLVRRNIMSLVRSLSRHIDAGTLDELTLTTNGSQLARFAGELADAGVRRINVSIDTLDPVKFKAITRWGDLAKVLDGRRGGARRRPPRQDQRGGAEGRQRGRVRRSHPLDARRRHGPDADRDDAARRDRRRPHRPVPAAQSRCAPICRDGGRWTDIPYKTGGPARYVQIAETGGRLGFITPLTHNFCEGCNRVRVTCTGTLFMCLGQEDAADLRAPLRASEGDELLQAAIDEAISRKPKGHDFVIDRGPQQAGGLPPHEHDRGLSHLLGA